jgi:DNA modification methylase
MDLELNKIYCMDCLEGIKLIPNKSVDLIFIDPPYGLNKTGILNDENLRYYYSILPDMFRVLKDDSFFITFASIGNLPLFFKDNPFTYRWQYIQYINNGMARGSLGFNNYISILIFQKGNAKIKKVIRDVYEMSTSSKQCATREHPTQKVLKVVEKIVTSFSNINDIVLDTFMGSGTTALACKNLKRNFIGFEICQDYVNIANKRLKETLEGCD